MSRPIFHIFTTPVNPIADGLVGYEKKVSRPMDMGTVSHNLSQQKYRSTHEWYEDMRLVFQNALDYHSPEAIWWFIASYGLGELKRMSVGLDVANQQKWLESLNDVSEKLARIISSPPNPTKANPLVAELRKRAEATPPVSKESIALGVEKLNSMLEDEKVREEVYGILKELEGMSVEEASKGPIDAEKISPLTVSVLLLYVGSRNA
jgi:hypothetical protein